MGLAASPTLRCIYLRYPVLEAKQQTSTIAVCVPGLNSPTPLCKNESVLTAKAVATVCAVTGWANCRHSTCSRSSNSSECFVKRWITTNGNSFEVLAGSESHDGQGTNPVAWILSLYAYEDRFLIATPLPVVVGFCSATRQDARDAPRTKSMTSTDIAYQRSYRLISPSSALPAPERSHAPRILKSVSCTMTYVSTKQNLTGCRAWIDTPTPSTSAIYSGS